MEFSLLFALLVCVFCNLVCAMLRLDLDTRNSTKNNAWGRIRVSSKITKLGDVCYSMKALTSILVLGLPLLIFSVAAICQEIEKPGSPLKKFDSPLSESLRSDSLLKSLKVIKPSELSKSEIQSVLNGDPCSFGLDIQLAQTKVGSLDPTDCRLDDGSYADFYLFEGTTGQRIAISLSADYFDPYLAILNESGTFNVQDDDSGFGNDALIDTTLPETGLYLIVATSYFPDEFGFYNIRVSTPPAACTFTLTPGGLAAPAAGGAFSFSISTQADCTWHVDSDPYSFLRAVVPNSYTGPGNVSFEVYPNDSNASRSTTIKINNVLLFTITQPNLVCTYEISPGSADHSPDAVTASFLMITQAGCPWRSTTPNTDYWLTTSNELQRGPGPVTYNLLANNGAAFRTSTITVAGQVFTIRQPGRNCSYFVSPTSADLSPLGQSFAFDVDTQPGCTWSFDGNFSWLYFANGRFGAGPANVPFTVLPNNSSINRTWNIRFNGLTVTPIVLYQSGTHTVSGRILTPQGQAVRNAIVTLRSASGIVRSTTSSSFGVYTFDTLLNEELYTLTVASKRYRYSPKTFSAEASQFSLDLIGLE